MILIRVRRQRILFLWLVLFSLLDLCVFRGQVWLRHASHARNLAFRVGAPQVLRERAAPFTWALRLTRQELRPVRLKRRQIAKLELSLLIRYLWNLFFDCWSEILLLVFFFDLLLVDFLAFRHSRSRVRFSVVYLDGSTLLRRLKIWDSARLLIVLWLWIMLCQLLVLLATRIESELPLRDQMTRLARHWMGHQGSLVFWISTVVDSSMKIISACLPSVDDFGLI